MSQISQRILLIGDAAAHVEPALTEALPDAKLDKAADVFEGMAAAQHNRYSAVLTALAPIERRPEVALRHLREAAGDARVILFADPSLEPLSRRMLSLGCDDYLVTPVTAGEVRDVLARTTTQPSHAIAISLQQNDLLAALDAIDVGKLVLDELLARPTGVLEHVVARIAALVAPHGQLLARRSLPQMNGAPVATAPVRAGESIVAHLELPLHDASLLHPVRQRLSHIAHLLGRAASLEERHSRLQRLAITDDLTGLYNQRYFKHFLGRMLELARTKRFPVTLLLFDIDNFKKYNDQFGHGVGDEILRQTSALMRKSCRDHDLVARIAGDEFAVVFWEKDPPRAPRDPLPQLGGRLPPGPQQIAARFRARLNSSEFTALGPSGQGTLTISGGMAVYPYDAQNADDLIKAADHALMFSAKRAGKNTIHLIGEGGTGDTLGLSSFDTGEGHAV